jgi:multidrug transporter EmrE-like cation transporter
MLVGNMFFGLGLYYGFGLTRFAIPAAIAMGVVVSFVYSVALLGVQVTLLKIIGAAVVILGVVVLAL